MQLVTNILYGGIFIKDTSKIKSLIPEEFTNDSSKIVEYPHIICFTFQKILIARLHYFLNNLKKDYQIIVDKISISTNYVYLHVKEVQIDHKSIPYYKNTKILLAKTTNAKEKESKSSLEWKEIEPLTLQAYSKLIFKPNEKTSSSTTEPTTTK